MDALTLLVLGQQTPEVWLKISLKGFSLIAPNRGLNPDSFVMHARCAAKFYSWGLEEGATAEVYAPTYNVECAYCYVMSDPGPPPWTL